MPVDGAALAIGPPLLLGLILSLSFERWLRPKPPRSPLPAAALALHAGLWLPWQVVFSLLIGRPWLALVVSLIGTMTLVVVSNAKYRSLREPFTVHDFEYFVDMVRHPRLYLPFLRFTTQTTLASIFMFVALVGAFFFEPWLFTRYATRAILETYGAVSACAALLLVLGDRARLEMSWNALADLETYGLVTSLWCYARESRRAPPPTSPLSGWRWPSEVSARPHLIVVQSESFFDCRRLDSVIRPDVLGEFDRVCTEAAHHGRLRVPAWGANTIRTEFGFLFGLSAEAQGVHKFQPYQRLARQGLPQLVSLLRNSGYHTVCVHPYSLDFYDRKRLFPALGFETLIDVAAFTPRDRAGPYVGDEAVTRVVEKVLADAGARPCFVFVITMENHGPLHLETADPSMLGDFYTGAPPPKHHDLSVYLGHLRHADAMIGRLRETLSSLPRPGCMAWYGDHVPIMPKVYARLDHDDSRTDYVLWSSAERIRATPVAAQERAVEELPLAVLEMLVATAGSAAPV